MKFEQESWADREPVVPEQPADNVRRRPGKVVSIGALIAAVTVIGVAMVVDLEAERFVAVSGLATTFAAICGSLSKGD